MIRWCLLWTSGFCADARSFKNFGVFLKDVEKEPFVESGARKKVQNLLIYRKSPEYDQSFVTLRRKNCRERLAGTGFCAVMVWKFPVVTALSIHGCEIPSWASQRRVHKPSRVSEDSKPTLIPLV
jgi:hypothetical protein